VPALSVIALLTVVGASLAHQTKVDAGEVGPASEVSGAEASPAGAVGDAWPGQTNIAITPRGRETGIEFGVGALFKRADLVVQIVMSMLLVASVACWTVFLIKTFEVARTRRRLRAALAALENARFLSDAADLEKVSGEAAGTTVLGRLIDAALTERRLSEGLVADGTVIDRYLLRASEIVRNEARRIARSTGLLATIGAIAPFVGLFGTVWGIMNSFIGISQAQTTNLAVVAPGIAEALLATAMGLVAAIPAVIFYNFLARGTKACVEEASEGSGMVVRLLSRELARPERRFAVRAAE
jgi:biopolymer transport protein ExbB